MAAAADPTGTGLAGSEDGYTFVPAADAVSAGTPKTLTFHVVGPDGHPVTRYQPYQSKPLSCYVIRSDLSGFQYPDAAMQQDGTWNVALPALPGGSYRAFVTFAAPDASHGTPLVHVLSRPFTVPGAAGGTPPERDTYTVVAATDLKAITAVRLEVLADPSLPANGPGRPPNGNFVLSTFALTTAPKSDAGKGQPVKFKTARATV